MGLSADELNFQRLLFRSKKLSADGLSQNAFRLKTAVERLEEIFSKLQDDNSVEKDILMQYGRDLHQLKVIVDAEHNKTVEDKLKSLGRLPKSFPDISESDVRRRNPLSGQEERFDDDVRDRTPEISNSLIKAHNEAVYRADLRSQLLGSRKKTDVQAVHNSEFLSKQEETQGLLADQLLRLTSEMKRNFSVAGSVIKEDNSALDVMHKQMEDNRTNLEREGKRLEYHAYRSCFDCLMLLVVILVIWSFIGMVLIMKVFQKKF
ncbi:CBN-USE-1 protein [Aphelenchoides avenae]|nr:CBN-USE-1 protein [Aphelenchus avenae]